MYNINATHIQATRLNNQNMSSTFNKRSDTQIYDSGSIHFGHIKRGGVGMTKLFVFKFTLTHIKTDFEPEDSNG